VTMSTAIIYVSNAALVDQVGRPTVIKLDFLQKLLDDAIHIDWSNSAHINFFVKKFLKTFHAYQSDHVNRHQLLQYSPKIFQGVFE